MLWEGNWSYELINVQTPGRLFHKKWDGQNLIAISEEKVYSRNAFLKENLEILGKIFK